MLPPFYVSLQHTEAKKLKRLRLLTKLRTPISGEATKEHEPSFLLGHFQVELRKARLQLALETLCVPLVLEAHHKIVSEPDEVGLSLALRLEPLLEPQIENKVQVDISQQRAEYALNAKDNFQFERKIFDWRRHHCVLDLRRKREYVYVV